MNSYLVISIAMTGGGGEPTQPHALLDGFALLHARRSGNGPWTFEIRVEASEPGASAGDIVTSFADALPTPGVLIARSPTTQVYDPLLAIAAAMDGPVGHHLSARVVRAFTSAVVDLDIPYGHCERATGNGDPATSRAMLRGAIINDWLEFLRRAGGDRSALDSTERWLGQNG